MKLNITEEEYMIRLMAIGSEFPDQSEERDAVTLAKRLGITFKQKLDWEAETHDPSQIPDKWLVEAWGDGDFGRSLTFFIPMGADWDNYRAIKKEDWPKWAIEAHETLEY